MLSRTFVLFYFTFSLVTCSSVSFKNLSVPVMANIFSYHYRFLDWAELSHFHNEAYHESISYLISERVLGADQNKNFANLNLNRDFRALGTLALSKRIESNNLPELINLMNQILRNAPHNQIIQTRLIFQYLKDHENVSHDVISNFFANDPAGYNCLANLTSDQWLNQNQNFIQSFKTFFTHLRMFNVIENSTDRIIRIIPFIANNLLLKELIIFCKNNQLIGLLIFSGYFSYIILSGNVTESQLNDQLSLFLNSFDYNCNPLQFFIEEIIFKLETLEQVRLFSVLIRHSNIAVLDHLRMPLMLLLSPQNWPEIGTWPNYFNIPAEQFNETDGLDDFDFDFQAILYKTYLMARRFNQTAIMSDISTCWPRANVL